MNNTSSNIRLSIYIICISFIVPNTYALSIDYQTNISINGTVSENNSKYNIEKAKLLEKYVDGLLEEIFELKREHAINNKAIDQYVFELKRMSASLKKIQTLNIEKDNAESVTNSIIQKLSSSKIEIGTLLKEELEKSKLAFSLYKKEKVINARIISTRMTKFVNTFSPKVEKLSNTQKKTDIILSLNRIRTASNSLGGLGDRLFSSQLKMNETYNNYVKEIRRELQVIRAIIVSK